MSEKDRGSINGEIGGCRAEIRIAEKPQRARARPLKKDSWKEKLGGRDKTSILQRAGAHFEDTMQKSTWQML